MLSRYLPECHHVVCIRDGTIQEQGSYDALLASQGPFSKFIDDYLSAHDGDQEEHVGDSPERPSPSLSRSPKSIKSPTTPGKEVAQTEKTPLLGQQLVKKEAAETGQVKADVYRKYFVAVGVAMITVLVGLCVTTPQPHTMMHYVLMSDPLEIGTQWRTHLTFCRITG